MTRLLCLTAGAGVQRSRRPEHDHRDDLNGGEGHEHPDIIAREIVNFTRSACAKGEKYRLNRDHQSTNRPVRRQSKHIHLQDRVQSRKPSKDKTKQDNEYPQQGLTVNDRKGGRQRDADQQQTHEQGESIYPVGETGQQKLR